MLRKAMLAGAAAVLATSPSLAFAATPGTYTGSSDDAEAITVKVSANGKEVTLFKVDQGMECGVTKVTKDAKINSDGVFKMALRSHGTAFFKVKGTFADGVPSVSGNYTQVVCDGQKDSWEASQL